MLKKKKIKADNKDLYRILVGCKNYVHQLDKTENKYVRSITELMNPIQN